MKNCLRCSRFRFLLFSLIAAFLATLIACLVSPCIIRSIDDLFRLLSDKSAPLSAALADSKGRVLGVSRSEWATFAEVFSSLDSAPMQTYGRLAAAFALPGAFLTGLLVRNVRKSSVPVRVLRIVLAVILGLIFLLAVLAAALFMTDVNGIRLGRVVLSLIQNFDAIASML